MLYSLFWPVSSFENYWWGGGGGGGGGAPRTTSISYSAKVCIQFFDIMEKYNFCSGIQITMM